MYMQEGVKLAEENLLDKADDRIISLGEEGAHVHMSLHGNEQQWNSWGRS